MVIHQLIIILNLRQLSFPPFRENALKWFPPDSDAHADALLMKAVCSHFIIPQLCSPVEADVALVGGRVISSRDVPLGDQVAALSSVLTDFENDLLSETIGETITFSEFHGAFCFGFSRITLPELKEKLNSGLYSSLKLFLADIHALVSSSLLLTLYLIYSQYAF